MRLTAAQLAGRLRAAQDDGGGFASTITHRGGRLEADRNGFTTALVLRELRSLPVDLGLGDVVDRALDFLERCADPRMPGAYGFWPLHERPAWAHGVPADCDDTAVLSLELTLHGRRSLQQTRDGAFDVLASSLITDVPARGPGWIRPLTFPTWLDPEFRARDNVVDCAVNANVLALLSVCDLRDLPGYAESASMIDAAVALVVRDDPRDRALRLWSLTPYYPDPRVFQAMLEHAASCGVAELGAAVRGLREQLALGGTPSGRRVLCGNAYGGPLWHCPALDLVRGQRGAWPTVGYSTRTVAL